METSEFDATLGGTEHLPHSANSLKFAASRSIEIAAMTESIINPSKTKLIFQTLPVHMRRRVMSHNSKRLPRKLREGHLIQLKKSGLPPKQKRPSRKYRRRPENLLEDYNRRQKRNVWLETHIWHAKRFHMIERWGHRLAYAPCDKAFRACYRASSKHCLLQDISYYTPIEIRGEISDIKDMFDSITSPSCGLNICAKAYVNGNREGTVHLYTQNSFPFGYIGKVQFIWVPNDINSSLWLFVHPSQAKEVESVLSNIANPIIQQTKDYETTIKRRKITESCSKNIQIRVLPGNLNRFRLTGPNSQAILAQTLKCVDNIEKIANNKWVGLIKNKTEFNLEQKNEYWQNIKSVNSPSLLPSRMITGLIVKDPRLSRPSHRTKACNKNGDQVNVTSLLNIPAFISSSPLWNSEIHETITKEKKSNTQFIQHITKTQLVPGEVNEDDPALQSIPVVAIQRPGSQDANYKKIGYGSGWDIIIPPGYAIFFWHTFIMFGARSGGLRETENLYFETGECYLPPDSNAGTLEEKRIQEELREKYFRLPPSKRINYIKMAINSPFVCPWKILLKDWSNSPIKNFFILRDKRLLINLQNSIHNKTKLPQIENGTSCLVAVYIKLVGKGNLKRHALICLPDIGDANNLKTLYEPHHDDPNEKIRKLKRKQHISELKSLRRKRIKIKKNGKLGNQEQSRNNNDHLSEYIKKMRELWIPHIDTVRHSSSKQILGYLSQAAFSFSEAQSCGVGYVAYNALSFLMENGQNQVLIRNTSSRKYRLANIQIIMNV